MVLDFFRKVPFKDGSRAVSVEVRTLLSSLVAKCGVNVLVRARALAEMMSKTFTCKVELSESEVEQVIVATSDEANCKRIVAVFAERTPGVYAEWKRIGTCFWDDDAVRSDSLELIAALACLHEKVMPKA